MQLGQGQFNYNQFKLYYILILSMIQIDCQQKNQRVEDNQIQDSNNKRYTCTSYQQRLQLIDFVEKQGFSIYKASKVLGIKNSTAKVIMRQFRRKGYVFKRKSESKVQRLPKGNTSAVSKKEQRQRTQTQVVSSQQEGNAVVGQFWLPYFAYQGIDFYCPNVFSGMQFFF